MKQINATRTIPVMLLAALLLLVLSVTCASAQRIERLNVGTIMQVRAINIDDYYFGIMRAMLTHKGLIKIGEDGRFIGDLASTWSTDDAITWRFDLVQGMTWHDGTMVTAEDIRFSIDYYMDKIPVYKHHFKLIQKVEALDSSTVVITLSEANPRFLVNLAVLRTLPKHIFETVENPKAFQGEKAAIGCGPYKFDGFDPAAGIVRFKTYDKYYRGRPNVDEIVFRMFKNQDTMYMALRKGSIDLPYFYASGTDPVYAASFAKHPGIKIHELPFTGVPNVLFFNTQQPPMDNPVFRKALSFAIDYNQMVKYFTGGFGSIPNKGFVPKGTAGFIETPVQSYDPKKAASLLASIGYRDTDSNGVLDKDGRALEIEIIVRTDIDASIRVAELLKKRFADIGVLLRIKTVDSTLFRQISDRERSHMTLLSRTTPWGMMMWAGSGSGYYDSRNIGWANLSDPAFHRIVDRMNSAIKHQDYEKAAAELQRYYADQKPGIPLYWSSILQPANASLTGWKISPIYGFLWEKTWYSLKKETAK